ncbi:MAG: SGNH/GDSL hydrolase family protein [Fimbriimonas sp.]
MIAVALATVFLAPSAPPKLLIRPQDRIAILGDSITEQKQYSRIIETYLRVCTPELGVDVRQYGWSGETWDGMLGRMQNDVLRFKPTLATSCYGMNDHGYRAYEQGIGDRYTRNTETAVSVLRAAGARVVLGSPGTIGKVPTWVQGAGSVDAMQDNLAKLSDITKATAQRTGSGYADVNGIMAQARLLSKKLYGDGYTLEGNDGVHPGWSGHLVMAYAFLKGLGVSGEIGTIQVQLGKSAKASPGHKILSVKGDTVNIESQRYPFCIPAGDVRDTYQLASGASLVPFFRDLNRFTLVVKGTKPGAYEVKWGDWTKKFTSAELNAGINLAEFFPENPFTAAFNRVDNAVAAKQAYETDQIKTLFHSEQGRRDLDGVANSSEPRRTQLVQAINAERTPVTHSLTITLVQF